MSVIVQVLSLLLWLYMLILIARMVLDWVQVFARQWRPSGAMLVVANVVYGLTDPPLRALRRVIPPLRLGHIALDLGFIVLFLAVVLARSLLGWFAAML